MAVHVGARGMKRAAIHIAKRSLALLAQPVSNHSSAGPGRQWRRHVTPALAFEVLGKSSSQGYWLTLLVPVPGLSDSS